MNDQYIDEIRAIRDRQYEETKNMTPEEEAKYTCEKVEWAKKRLEELRHQNESSQQPVESGR